MRSRLLSRRRARGQEGAILVFTAVALVALLGATALSVDFGRLTVHKRSLQAVADAAAADARFALGQASANTGVVTMADASALRNGFDPNAAGNSLVAIPGTNALVNSVQTFCPWAGASLPTPAGCPAAITDLTLSTAVQVTVSGSIPFFFAPAAGGALSGSASATGTYSTSLGGPITPMTGVRVGSYLAAADPSNGSDLGSLLGGLLGDSSIQAVGYSGLASGDVTLGQLATALGVGTPSRALTTSVSYPQLVAATISALDANPSDPGASAALTVLNGLSTELTGSFPTNITLGQLLNLSSPGDASAASAYLNVADIVTGGAEISNGQNFLSAPGISLALDPATLLPELKALGVINSQLGAVKASVTAIQAPQSAYGPVGTKASTAQVAVTATATVTAQMDVQVLGVIGLQLADVTFTVPVTFDLAGATGQVTSISCGSGTPVTIATTANTSAAYLGDVSMVGGAVTPQPPTALLSLTVLGLTAGATGDASTALAQASPDQSFTFTGPFSAGVRGPDSLSQPSLDPSFNLTLTATGSSSVVVPVTTLASASDDIAGNLVTAMNPLLTQLGAQVGGADTYNLAYPATNGVACATSGLF